jgi:hypothetical protein
MKSLKTGLMLGLMAAMMGNVDYDAPRTKVASSRSKSPLTKKQSKSRAANKRAKKARKQHR